MTVPDRRRCRPGLLQALLLVLAGCCQHHTASAAGSQGLRRPSIAWHKLKDAGELTPQKTFPSVPTDWPRVRLANHTHSGYVPVNEKAGSDMFYIFYEAQEPPQATTPIVLWLQGGPGCSSLFGMLYINGPYFVNPDDLTLRPNLGSWNRMYGVLYIEQPIGTGFSHAGKQPLPTGEVQVARDLYAALNAWYKRFPAYAHRPLIIAGESYAGKYVPSISHYILEARAQAEGWLHKLDHPRRIGADVPPPAFTLGGLAIGNGWTDANSQQLVQGDVAWALGLIDGAQRQKISELNYKILQLVESKEYRKARALSDRVNQLISNWSGTYTLEDVRRNLGYDGYMLVDQHLNQPEVKAHFGADPAITWESCSPAVDKAMGHDVMKSVKRLVVDLLDHYPVFLYEGQFDAECGVASNDAWVSTLPWKGHKAFNTAPRHRWYVNDRILGFWRQHGHLTQLVVRNAGHMVPHDNPYYGQLLIERWIQEVVRGSAYNRSYSEEDERRYLHVRGPDEGSTAGPPKDAQGRSVAAADVMDESA